MKNSFQQALPRVRGNEGIPIVIVAALGVRDFIEQVAGLEHL